MSEGPTPESKPLTEAEVIEKKARDKKAEFEANPDRFVSLNDLVVAVMRTDAGPAMYCRPHSRLEAIMAKGEVDAVMTKLVIEMDIQTEMEKKGAIVQPKGGIMNAARRGLFRK